MTIKQFDYSQDISPVRLDKIRHDILNKSKVITLVNIFDENNMPNYAYILLRAKRFNKFIKEVSRNTDIDLFSWGEVVEQGEGLFPAKEVKERIKNKFLFDTDNVLANQFKMMSPLS